MSKTVFAARLWRLFLLILFIAANARGAPVAVVSGAHGTNASAAGGSYLPVFSPDGGTVTFLSHAKNLVTNDGSSVVLNVFRSVLQFDFIECVSEGTNRTDAANADCYDISVSRHGLNVAFASRASNLTPNDTNNAVDGFFRYGAGATFTPLRLSSADPNGQSPADPVPYSVRPLSTSPRVAALVDRVVFVSAASNLVAGVVDTNDQYDVFVRSGNSGVRLVSASLSGTSANGSSHSPQISEDGRFVSFISSATDLVVGGPTNSGGDIYVRDLDSDGPPIWLSRFSCDVPVGHFPAPLCDGGKRYRCVNYALSGDGQHAAYIVDTGPNTATFVFYSSVGGTNAARVGEYAFPIQPQISRFGDWVAYSGYGSPIGIAHSNVCLWARASGSNMVVSTTPNGVRGSLWSRSPVMSADGEFVAFLSESALVPGAPSDRFQVYAYRRSSGRVELVSLNTNGEPSSGNFQFANLSIAPEGPLAVAFDSPAADLVANDFNGASDVFVRFPDQGETRLISRSHNLRPNRTALAMSGTLLDSMSSNGAVIAFTSLDNPMVAGDTNNSRDVYTRDLASGEMRRLTSVRQGFWAPEAALGALVSPVGNHVLYFSVQGPISGGASGNQAVWCDVSAGVSIAIPIDPTYQPLAGGVRDQRRTFGMSSNGSMVVYQQGGQLWSRQMPVGPTNIVSINYSGSGPANNVSSNVVLSPNDRWVVFQSAATDIVYFEPLGGGTYSPPRGTLYARDLLSNTSKVASITASNIVPVKGPAVFSADSEWIGYVVTNREIYVRQLTNNFRTNVCASCDQPSLSGDASFVAYQTVPASGPSQIHVKNMRTGVAKLISASALGAEANGPSMAPQITTDGRFIVFQSTASNLVENDNNDASDIFLGDRLLGKVLLLSINRMGGGSGNGSSSKAVLSADGRAVVFQSLANDLIAGDYNDRRDVFVASLSLPDSDSDGMDDDFEITYFGNLERNGAGDMDNDEHTDQEEFLTGTNPTDDSSILHVVSISAPGSTARQLVWSSTPGRTYVVQFKDALADNWSTLPGSVRASASTATATDDVSNPHRFYRVVMDP
jgi:hypothetical protein